MELFCRVYLLMWVIGPSIAPPTDRENFLRNLRREFNDCMGLLLLNNNFSNAAIQTVRTRVSRLQSDVQLAQNAFLNNHQAAHISRILSEILERSQPCGIMPLEVQHLLFKCHFNVILELEGLALTYILDS